MMWCTFKRDSLTMGRMVCKQWDCNFCWIYSSIYIDKRRKAGWWEIISYKHKHPHTFTNSKQAHVCHESVMNQFSIFLSRCFLLFSWWTTKNITMLIWTLTLQYYYYFLFCFVLYLFSNKKISVEISKFYNWKRTVVLVC